MAAAPSMSARLSAQLDFLLTCDRLKTALRTTRLHDGSRLENSAEHSWHLALLALTLAEYAPAGTDVGRVVRLLLVHDLVEIGAGDLSFDAPAEAQAAQQEAEARAAAEFLGLWQEFEARQTTEVRFARALDALQPMLLTWGPAAQGCAASHPELTRSRVLGVEEKHLREFPELWAAAQAQARGVLQP